MKRMDRFWLSFTKNGRALKRGADRGDIAVDRTPLAGDPNPPVPVTIISVSKRGTTTTQWTPRKRRAHRRVELGLLGAALGLGVASFWVPQIIGLAATLLALAYLHIRTGIGMDTPFVDITTMVDINIERRPE